MSPPATAIPNYGKKYREIWKDIGVPNWVSILTSHRADGGWKTKGDRIEGRCPYPNHTDTTPSFHLMPERGIARCYGCGRGTSNPLQFFADITGGTWTTALTELRSKFNLRSISPKMGAELQELERAQEVKTLLGSVVQLALVAAKEALDRNPHDMAFHWAVGCLKYLEKRKIPTDVATLKSLPIGILPPLKVIRALLGEVSATLCMPTLENWLTAQFVGSLVFVYHTTPFTVGGIKLRADFLNADNEYTVRYVVNPDKAPIGLFGLGHFKTFMQGSHSNCDALIVEGEFDALAHMVGQLKDDKAYDVVIATGGNTSCSLDSLRDFGVSRALLLADSPEGNGDVLVRAWLGANSLPMKVFSWPMHVREKDPDDAIKRYGWDSWSRVLTELDPSTGERLHFQYPHIWAIERLRERLPALDPDNLRGIKELCGDVGECLKDPAEQRAYVTAATAATGLMPSDILSLLMGRDSSEEGFIQKILFALKQEYTFLGTEPDRWSGTKIQFWHKTKRQMKTCNVSKPSDMFSAFQVDLGSFVSWITTCVGLPDWATTKMVGKMPVPMGLLEQEAVLKRYFEFAVATLLRELPTMENLKELKAGSHYIDFKTPTGVEKRWLIVNGHDVFLGIPSEGLIDWKRLDGPQFGEYALLLSRQKWSDEIRATKDLAEGNSYDVKAAYNFITDVLNVGWKFRAQREDVEYLAAAIMLNAVCSALPRQLYTVINGTRGSGKSSFLALLTNSHPEMRLLEACFGMDSYTAAGFRKEMNNCSLGAVLDEFEDIGGDGHSRHVREILKDVRGLTGNPECRILRGNSDSMEATEYRLRCQIWAAAIQYLRDEADVSRFVQIHTELVEGHPPPRISLGKKYSEADFTTTRRTVTMGLFCHVPQLLENIKILRQHYATQEAMQNLSSMARTEVPSRYLDGVIIPAALMMLCGKDPYSFVERFICAKATDLSRVVNMTHTQSLLEHLLSAQFEYKRPESDVRFSTIRSLLSVPTDRNLLNTTESGVHYLEFPLGDGPTGKQQRWLVVVWADALQGVLRSVPAYRTETPSRLKQLAESDTLSTVPSRRISEVPSGQRRQMKFAITPNDFTIYNLTDMISQWDAPDRET